VSPGWFQLRLTRYDPVVGDGDAVAALIRIAFEQFPFQEPLFFGAARSRLLFGEAARGSGTSAHRRYSTPRLLVAVVLASAALPALALSSSLRDLSYPEPVLDKAQTPLVPRS
jgi:hypothetical protein